jgi:hypothetical protein
MTPQEKAEQLIEKYKNINHVIFTLIKDKPVIWIAKTCAIIAVDEIINSYNVLLDINEINNGAEHIFYEQNYWKEVKQEIDKL